MFEKWTKTRKEHGKTDEIGKKPSKTVSLAALYSRETEVRHMITRKIDKILEEFYEKEERKALCLKMQRVDMSDVGLLRKKSNVNLKEYLAHEMSL